MKSEFKKDDCVTLHIEDIGTGGEGIGKADGFTFFVKDAIVGDVIEAKIMKLKKNYGYARLMKVLTPSKDRVEPKCPVARQCGGCQIQEMRYEAQLAFKQKMVQNNLERIGGLSDFEMYPVIGMETPYAYRNKAQFRKNTSYCGADRLLYWCAGKRRSASQSQGIYAEKSDSPVQ